MLKRIGIKRAKQKGFTVIELLIGIAILGVLAPVLGMSIIHIVDVNESTGNHLQAVKQVERAVYWISRDAKMSQITQTDEDNGFPLSLYWKRWDNTTANVTYTIQDNELLRSYSYNGEEPVVTAVAEYINDSSENTTCDYDGTILSFRITVSIGGYRPASETRQCIIVPKPQ